MATFIPQYNDLMLRSAIGITTDGFEISEQDYWELYQSDPPIDYERFKDMCDQIKAKWPSQKLFAKLDERYDQMLLDD